MSDVTTPVIIEKDGRNPVAYDIYSWLLKDRIIFLRGEVNDDSANSIVAQLMYLASLDQTADIKLYINSPGGSITAGLAIYDMMQHVKCDVATYCIGMAASMGAVLLTAGAKGKRYVLPNGRVLIHQPLINGVVEGVATDIEIQAVEIENLKNRLYKILSDTTGKPIDQIERDCDRDKWLTAEEAVAYGLVDSIK